MSIPFIVHRVVNASGHRIVDGGVILALCDGVDDLCSSCKNYVHPLKRNHDSEWLCKTWLIHEFQSVLENESCKAFAVACDERSYTRVAQWCMYTSCRFFGGTLAARVTE